MSPEKKRDFEAEWPLLARRLRHFLNRKKVSTSKQEDLIQETALRLYRMWDSVDRTKPAWALTVTIVLNLLRDEYRRSVQADIVGGLPDLPQSYDVERAGIARVELGRVRNALAEMSPAHRAVLLAEIGHPTLEAVVDQGEKMRRMRARRKLTSILERVSAVILMPAKKLADIAHAIVAARDPILAGTSCLLCTVLGAGVVISTPLVPSDAHAAARAVPQVTASDAVIDGIMQSIASVPVATGYQNDVAPSSDLSSGRESGGDPQKARKRARRAAGSTDAPSGGLPVSGLPVPQPGDDPLPSVPPPPEGAVPEPDPPNLSGPNVTPPGGGGGDHTPDPGEEIEAVVAAVEKADDLLGN